MSEQLHPLQTSLSLAQASAILDECLAVRQKEGLLPLAVAVLDAGGQLVAFKREDGCGVLRYDIAFGKAWAALGMGMSTRLIRDRLANRLAFQSALASASDGRFIPVPGGVLILNKLKSVIGAVGVSGDASDRDEYCAIQAIQAAGLGCEPASHQSEWRNAAL
jgi:glc operon protein GlcG